MMPEAFGNDVVDVSDGHLLQADNVERRRLAGKTRARGIEAVAVSYTREWQGAQKML